jgi:hypothetical protein
MAKLEELFREARELYREAQVELKSWSEPQEGEIQFLKEELAEALLDLKQSVIDLSLDDAERYIREVKLLTTELQTRRKD